MVAYRVYIDESGDEGFKFLPEEAGSSRWFVLSAAIIRKDKDTAMTTTARKAREIIKKPPKHPLHFRNLRHEHRVPLIRLISEAPIKTVSILIHKPSIEDPENFQQEPFSLYRYATRLLLERVSWLCRDNQKGSDGMAELIFSNRSIMSYEDLRKYICKLQKDKNVSISWAHVAPEYVRAINHEQLAGLQIADAVASGVYFAVNRNQYGEIEDRYLRLLSTTLYRHKGNVEGYGLKFWSKDNAEMRRIIALTEIAGKETQAPGSRYPP